MSQQWKVTPTTQMGYGPARSCGYGFSLQHEGRRESCTFIFGTEEDSKAVEEAMRQVVEVAKDISFTPIK